MISIADAAFFNLHYNAAVYGIEGLTPAQTAAYLRATMEHIRFLRKQHR